ncbi:hypothetical protein [Aestuariibius sp. HNIBRBA575]|uniref:hypothetical protein n=1 Tax=Aestuariibius sp. HNIBRBA575 TaxID=3233343 RepID=UPI0034A430F0
MKDEDLGFTYKRKRNGDVEIFHRGAKATTLRGEKASWFIEDMQDSDLQDQQQDMARLTGNYKRGNERKAKDHPRNKS